MSDLESRSVTATLPDDRARVVLDAVVDLVAERGLAATRLRDVSARVGMVPSHLLYYFGSKEGLFLAALEHAEDVTRRRAARRVARSRDPWTQLDVLIDSGLPSGRGDPRWVIWLEAWELATREPRAARLSQVLGERYAALFEGVIHAGGVCGAFRIPDIEAVVLELMTLLDGLAVRLLVEPSRLSRADAHALIARRSRELLAPPG